MFPAVGPGIIVIVGAENLESKHLAELGAKLQCLVGVGMSFKHTLQRH